MFGVQRIKSKKQLLKCLVIKDEFKPFVTEVLTFIKLEIILCFVLVAGHEGEDCEGC